MVRKPFVTSLLLLAVFVRGAAAYTITNLGPTFQPSALNNVGQVVGGCDSHKEHICLWTDGVLEDLGTLPGATNIFALDINDAGEIVGVASISNSFQAFLYTDGELRALEPLVPGDTTYVYGINDRGEVVGHEGYWDQFPVVWRDGVPERIPCLPDDSLYANCWAFAINDDGTLVGMSTSGTLPGRRLVHWTDDGIEELGALSLEPRPRGAGDGGQVVGYHLGYMTTRALVWDAGVETDVGVDLHGVDLSINDLGQAIGLAYVSPYRSEVFLYQGGDLVFLDDVFPINTWHLTDPYDINDVGQVLAQASSVGTGSVGVVLTLDVCADGCDDGNVCTLDSCAEAGLCAHAPANEGAACTATTCGVCEAGACVDSDGDADGLCAAADNCPAVANPDQSDFDGDAQGDVCDPSEVDAVITRANLVRTTTGAWMSLNATLPIVTPDVLRSPGRLAIRVTAGAPFDVTIDDLQCESPTGRRITCTGATAVVDLVPDSRWETYGLELSWADTVLHPPFEVAAVGLTVSELETTVDFTGIKGGCDVSSDQILCRRR